MELPERPISAAEIATILVVDDNEANRMLARETLEDEGHRVIVANDGRAGLDAFDAERPDCVLIDVRMPELDGVEMCKALRARPNGDDVPVIFLTALRDVDTFDRALAAGGDDFLTKPVRPTELAKRVEACLRLRKMRSELVDLYALMKEQRDDMMRLQLQKERLSAFIVHDLKNPVNAMDLGAQLLLRDKSLSAASRPIAEKIRFEARQLTRLIMNLLDLSKADEGALAPKRGPIDGKALVARVVGDLEWTATAHDVVLESRACARPIQGDESLIERALTNLVENAVRHAPRGSTVRVSADEVSGGVELRVEDAGGGVPESMREKVFDPFVQVDDGPTSRSGRGLGLAFCKIVARAHGGEIRVEDAKPGARFLMLLPD